MNNQGAMQQEKMELDLEIPSSLAQSDGHLRRSNSAPMINGLRFLLYYSITITTPCGMFICMDHLTARLVKYQSNLPMHSIMLGDRVARMH